jgi:microcystin-dependent protein
MTSFLAVPAHFASEALPACGDVFVGQMRTVVSDVGGRPDGIYFCAPGASDWQQVGTVAETVQDAIGTILVDTASINLSYNDATPSISADAIFGTTATTVAAGNHIHPLTDSSSINLEWSGANLTATAIFGTTAGTVAEGHLGFKTGDMKMWAFTAAPTGWLLCNGQTVLRSSPLGVLLVADGLRFGVGDGTTTVNLPDLTGRFPFGLGTHADNDVIGEVGGVRTVSLSANESGVPAHDHEMGGAGSHGHSFIAAGAHGHSFGAAGAHGHGFATKADHDHSYDKGSVTTRMVTDDGTSQVQMVESYSNNNNTTSANGSHDHGFTNEGTHTHGFTNADTHDHQFANAVDHEHNVITNIPLPAVDGHTNMPPFLTLNFVIKD